MAEPSVAVIIAAYRAGATVGRAVESALGEPETAEIFVVDDASGDDTAERAEAAGSRDPRFRLLRQPFNQGPSAARNRVLALAGATHVAVLDADDVFMPGRLGAILSVPGWDLCADNIAFTRDPSQLVAGATAGDRASNRRCTIDLARFVEGNISRRNVRRGELGFLKPVIRRAFLERHGLRFDERCRLGEDFLLYAEMLGLGARFELLERCGYLALERDNSLSATHSVAHLRALLSASRALAARLPLGETERRAMERHRRTVRDKVVHREILEQKRFEGLASTLSTLATRPGALRDIGFDLFGARKPPPVRQRLLIAPHDFDQLCR